MILPLLLILTSAVENDVFIPFQSGVSFEERSGVTEIRFNEDQGFLSSEPGSPLVPVVSRVFILPGNCDVTSVECKLSFNHETWQLSSPLPGAEVLTSTDRQVTVERTASAEGISGESPVVSCHTGTILSTYTIVSCSINPWKYDRSSGALDLASSCELAVNWETVQGPGNLSPLQAELVNYRLQQISGRSIPVQAGSDASVDYLIITSESISSALTPLLSLLDSRSYTTEVVTVQNISGAWSGADVQEDIRNCIRDYVLNQGTAYVLLAGDEDVVPVREVYTECEGLSELAPCDLYYSDLDGSWDDNGNGIYGEWEDSLDLYADVVLGRLLFSTAQEAATVVAKNIEYAGAGDNEWYRSAVLCGAMLFADVGYVGAKGCRMTTKYFPNNFELTEAYELQTGDHPDTYFPAIYSGAGWNHYAGHGDQGGIWWGDGSAVMAFTRMAGFDNPGQYGIHTAIGCHTGDFTEPATFGCLADTLLTLADGGGIACFFNSTWGWEGYWPEIGSSERLCLNTVKQVYYQKAPTVGLAYTAAMDSEIPLMTGPYDRVMQSVLAYTAFAEPSLEVLGVSHETTFPPQPFRLLMMGPNPVFTNISFKVTGASTAYNISIFDISGRKVMDTFSLPQNTLHQLDTEGLHPGVYFISARSSGGTSVSESFVKLR